MTRPVALLTDFGYADAYVGVMKGVLLTRCPGASLVDLTHGVPPQDVLAGALHLAAAVPYCPPETVFLAVVDPGVGSARRPICLRSGDHLFVGPDNGLLWPAAANAGHPEAFHLDRPEQWLPQVGATFHGRDVFAPVAAFLAGGKTVEEVGSPINDPVRLEVPRCVSREGGVTGQVLLVDGFGNAVTSLRPEDLGHPSPESWSFHAAEHEVCGPSTHYGAVPPGMPLVVRGSFGYYEVAVNGGSAARELGLQGGAGIVARRR